MSERLIRTHYSGAVGDRTAASATLIGAIRAAVVRIALGEYDRARIFDHRYGEDNPAAWAVTVHGRAQSIIIRWPRGLTLGRAQISKLLRHPQR